MAVKALTPPAEAEKPREPKVRPLFPAIDSGTTEHGLRWEDVDVLGEVYRLREITVDDDDAAFDAAENPDGETINARLQTRMQLAASIMSPPTAVDDMGSWPRLKLRALLFVFNRLNTLPPADAEGNA
jgi:hypothetical protein